MCFAEKVGWPRYSARMSAHSALTLQHTQRSGKAWAQAYREKRRVVDDLVPQFPVRARSPGYYRAYLSQKRKAFSNPGSDVEDEGEAKRMRKDD